MKQLTQAEIKKNLGHEAALLVQNGMRVGLGTGTTAFCFIESLIERCHDGLQIQAVSSSTQSENQARKGKIPSISMEDFTTLDLSIDGADEIDSLGRMIKGGGGALTREKILASSSKRLVILVDESKVVEKLGGKMGLPVEIFPFGYRATQTQIEQLGYRGLIRLNKDGSFYKTDNGNFIYDISPPKEYSNPDWDHHRLVNIPGVVETGLFLNFTLEVLIGYRDGSIKRVAYGRER